MLMKSLLRATALTAVVALPWLPAVTHAAEEIPTECLTNPAPEGPQGDPGPVGDPGPQGDPGPTGQIFTGPSRQPHQMTQSLPQCDDIDDICIVKQPGLKGPVGEKGETGDKGPDGPPGEPGDFGPSRAPHSLAGTDPCVGIAHVCQIVLVGATGSQGEQGPKGPDGPPGPPGTPGNFVNGPSRAPHGQPMQVTVEIPADCVDHLESLVVLPTTTVSDVGGSSGTLPETGDSTGTLAMVATVLLALGASVLMVRRRIAV